MEWKRLDSLVKIWIYGTISQPLLQMILKNTTAREVWTSLENLFRDNKDARAIQLDDELRNITIGNRSIGDLMNQHNPLSSKPLPDFVWVRAYSSYWLQTHIILEP
ncbi:hypothetical protein OSB04_027473 [Centaurea solstitialis]|uniref:Uncharacterized protein n=1 Tax=Centaurea solstitialis TaxID=347529 RepID=A0AA38VWR4_9ASTR|nr:hypothetical protein OSB04_027473 [Centaurea solstitialis]